MLRHASGLLAISSIMLALVSAARADPIKNANDLGAALLACWTPPAGVQDSFVTLSFSLRRDGSLIGKPRPVVINVAGDEQARKQFVDAAISAIEACVPVEFSPEFAAGVGGQVFTLRLESQE